MTTNRCPRCEGRGYLGNSVRGERCIECHGTGVIIDEIKNDDRIDDLEAKVAALETKAEEDGALVRCLLDLVRHHLGLPGDRPESL